MPRKVNELALTQKLVETLIDEGTISDRNLAKRVGTTSSKKVRQITNIAETAMFLFTEHALAEISKLPLHEGELEAVRRAFVIPRLIEVRDAPDIVTVESLPVYETRLKITNEVANAVTQSEVVQPEFKNRPLKVTLSKKFRDKIQAKN